MAINAGIITPQYANTALPANAPEEKHVNSCAMESPQSRSGAKKPANLAIDDGPKAGLAFGLPTGDHPMAFMAAGGDPSTNQQQAGGLALQCTAKGDLRTKMQKARSTVKKNSNKAMGTFECKGESVFEIMDPIDEKNSLHEPKPKAVCAAVQRSFVIDSGASYHLIGYKQLTRKEKGAIRPVQEPYRIQSANGIVDVDKEVKIFVPALNISVWAQLMQDCPPVLSLGRLCSRQGWNYQWLNGRKPTLSKGTRRITLTPNHDVPMVFAARTEQALTDTDDVSTAESSTATSSSQGRPSAREDEETSDSSREGDLPPHQERVSPRL